jgi:DNA-binding IclR family transcriptional regulator
MPDRSQLDSVRNAARLLKQFSYQQRELGVSELARRLGVGKSTAHRLVTTLAAEHLLEHDPETTKYRLGLAVYDLSAAVSAHFELHEAAVPAMAQLRNVTGEAVQLAVLDGREVVYVERLDSPNTLQMFLAVGRRNWAHCTGTGKLLLASLSHRQLERILDGWTLPQRTPSTITDMRLLHEELDDIRRRGWARNLNEAEIGAMSVAAGVRDATGEVVAAMSVAGPVQRMEAVADQLVTALLEATRTASRRMGYRGAAR